ncbi:UPF0271 protein [Litorivivens lipolytica]|uniref:UPF0271 protein n=1 Tax=Litorivivens lipolytica TaxID=1524264 RepID=A0A7W4W3Y1_9GAMM|nr:UPF0271 protein [Litorivivens lipolytica]
MSSAIDLNCDLGEGMGSDAELLQIVSSANIACGGHAGNAQTMKEAVTAAKRWGVNIGAHPGYEDKEHFGRRPQSLSDAEIQQLLHSQIDTLREIAKAQGSALTHVRAHGALGNLTDAEPHAAGLLSAVAKQQGLALMVLGQSAAEQAARETGVPVIRQFFADRAYDRHGQLVSRSLTDSVLHEPQRIIPRLLSALDSGKVTSIEGDLIPVGFDTICVHGDTDSALALAAEIRHALEQHGVTIRPYPPMSRSTRL